MDKTSTIKPDKDEAYRILDLLHNTVSATEVRQIDVLLASHILAVEASFKWGLSKEEFVDKISYIFELYDQSIKEQHGKNN